MRFSHGTVVVTVETRKGNTMANAAMFNLGEWLARVQGAGYSVTARGCIVTISKRFAPGDNDAFVDCDMFAGSYLAELPATQSGSTWGTDGGSVGGYSAIRSGCFTLNRSGISKRVVAKIAKA